MFGPTAEPTLDGELARLRTLEDAVRDLFDDVVDTEDPTVMGFPVGHYRIIEEALDALDELTGRHQT